MSSAEILDAGMLYELAEEALALVVACEWIAVHTSGMSHYHMCLGCNAEVSNTTRDDPALKHEPGCRVDAIVKAVKRGPLTHYADNDSEECETLCEKTKARDIITNARADVTCADCKERNGIKSCLKP